MDGVWDMYYRNVWVDVSVDNVHQEVMNVSTQNDVTNFGILSIYFLISKTSIL